MVPHPHIAAQAFVLTGVASQAQVHVPGTGAGGFQFPPYFAHDAAAAYVGPADGGAEAGCGNRAPAFAVEFVIPGQSIVEVTAAVPVVHPGSDAQQVAVHIVQAVFRLPGSEAVAAQMGVEVLTVHIQIPGRPPRAAPAFADHFIRQVENMAYADVTGPVTGIRFVAQVAAALSWSTESALFFSLPKRREPST